MHEYLTVASMDGRWSEAVDIALALPFLIAEGHPEQIDALRDAKIIAACIDALQDVEQRDSVRWHCCAVLWALVKHCSAKQVPGLYKLTAILGQVFQAEEADPHLRAAVLNTMQVLLSRGTVFVGQFINIRGSVFAGSVMEALRTYAHMELVQPTRDANSIMKYVAFTLANAVIYADKEQLLRLLEMGVYPLLFKIIALDGEPHNPEEAKLKAVAALKHIFDMLPEEVVGVQVRAERRKFNAKASWEMLRGIAGPTATSPFSSSAEAQEVAANNPWSPELRRRVGEVLQLAENLHIAT
jgi:hypothetical protein